MGSAAGTKAAALAATRSSTATIKPTLIADAPLYLAIAGYEAVGKPIGEWEPAAPRRSPVPRLSSD
jgi:hypothetical protein